MTILTQNKQPIPPELTADEIERRTKMKLRGMIAFACYIIGAEYNKAHGLLPVQMPRVWG